MSLYVGNDNVLTLDELKNAVDDSYINDATVTVIVVDSDGNEITGLSWPVTMAYVAASSGKYRVTLVDTLNIIAGTNYTAKITANAGVNLLGYWEIRLQAVTRNI